MEMVERVARAIYAHMPKPVIPVEWESLPDGGLQYIGMAMVAIEEMREPTECMVAEGVGFTGDEINDVQVSSLYKAMVDAALEESR